MNLKLTREDKEEFHRSCEEILEQERVRLGIGTLSEKTVHAVLKRYLVPDTNCHEIKCGRYVADILCDGEIMEIQTAGFNRLRAKLETFLKEYDVTVVYPIPHIKWLIWIDEETGEFSKKRRSPKVGSYQEAFYELYKIKMFLHHPNLHFRFILMDVEEYRLLNGYSKDRKKGSERYDRIPVELVEDKFINTPEDFKELVPKELSEPFSVKMFQKATKLSLGKARTAVNVLAHLGVIRQVGKDKNAYLYERNFTDSVHSMYVMHTID